MTLATKPTSKLPASEDDLRRFRFTYEQYYQMAEVGILKDKRVELIDGVIFDMSPQKDRHTAATLLAQQALQRALPELLVRTQMPLRVAENTELEPDVSVVKGRIRDYVGTGHPTSAVLVVEVSDATLRFDRGNKAEMYARARVTDYWIINLQDRCVEVYREPVVDATSSTGFRYRSMTSLKAGESVPLLVGGENRILVDDLLP